MAIAAGTCLARRVAPPLCRGVARSENPLELPAAIFAPRSSSSSAPASSSSSGRGSGGRRRPALYYSDWAEMPLGPRHRFPIDKYRQVRQQLEREASWQLQPGPLATFREACLVHDEEYVRSILTGEISEKERKKVGFNEAPLRSYVMRTFASLGATLAATRYSISRGSWSGAVSGGTHHAFASAGEGFCVFNDLAVAARVAQQDFGIERVLIVDLDVHQGNGTSRIFQGDDSVFTFDVHQARGYPFSTRSTSDTDLPLPDGCEDSAFLEAMAGLPNILEAVRPGLVLYQAGVDGLAGDRFGRLALTRAGLTHRNTKVYELCAKHGLPLVVTMGGGYNKVIENTVECSADVYRQLHSSMPT